MPTNHTPTSTEKQPVGRPTKYKPEYCQQIIDVMAKGFSITAFAGSIRVSRQSIYEWAEVYPDFSDSIRIARAARVYCLEEKLLESPDSPTVTSRIFALKNAAPDEWKDKHDVEHSGGVEIMLAHRADKTDEQIKNRVNALRNDRNGHAQPTA